MTETFKPLSETILRHHMCSNTHGIYLEAGANDGIQQSNTYLLEKERQWTGILIEPSPTAMEKCKQNRCSKNIFEQCILSSPEKEGNLMCGDFDGDLRGSVGAANWGYQYGRSPNIMVMSRTLGSILKEHNIKPDFISIDVEGHELEVMRGMDFSFCMPKYIVLEVTGNLGENQYRPGNMVLRNINPLFQYMRDHGYYATECLSNFNLQNNPAWNGQHQDYLFERVRDCWD